MTVLLLTTLCILIVTRRSFVANARVELDSFKRGK